MRFEGPMGSFFLRDESKKPLIFVAAGTGFAPIKAIIEEMHLKKADRPISLYWGVRRPDDLYLNGLCQDWAKEIKDFQYIPVVSDALPEDTWTGRLGLVHKAVLQDHPNMSEFQVYACGAPIMVNSAREEFTGLCHLSEEEFFADSFVNASDLAIN